MYAVGVYHRVSRGRLPVVATYSNLSSVVCDRRGRRWCSPLRSAWVRINSNTPNLNMNTRMNMNSAGFSNPQPPKSASQADAFWNASRERSFFFLRGLFGRATLRAAEHGSDRYLAVSIRAACELCTDADCRSRFSLAATNKLVQARKCACSTAAIRGGCSRNCLAP